MVKVQKVHRVVSKDHCPVCDSRNILTNKTGAKRCRRCGNAWGKAVSKE